MKFSSEKLSDDMRNLSSALNFFRLPHFECIPVSAAASLLNCAFYGKSMIFFTVIVLTKPIILRSPELTLVAILNAVKRIKVNQTIIVYCLTTLDTLTNSNMVEKYKMVAK